MAEFTAKVRVPTRPLSYENKDMAVNKELMIDYNNGEVYVKDVNGEIHCLTDAIEKVIMQNIETNPGIITDAIKVPLPNDPEKNLPIKVTAYVTDTEGTVPTTEYVDAISGGYLTADMIDSTDGTIVVTNDENNTLSLIPKTKGCYVDFNLAIDTDIMPYLAVDMAAFQPKYGFRPMIALSGSTDFRGYGLDEGKTFDLKTEFLVTGEQNFVLRLIFQDNEDSESKTEVEITNAVTNLILNVTNIDKIINEYSESISKLPEMEQSVSKLEASVGALEEMLKKDPDSGDLSVEISPDNILVDENHQFVTSAEKTAIGKISEKVSVKDYTFTIPVASWAGTAAPYTATISVPGIIADYVVSPTMDLVASSYYDTAKKETDSYQIYKAVTGANNITLYNHVKPTVALTIKLQVTI